MIEQRRGQVVLERKQETQRVVNNNDTFTTFKLRWSWHSCIPSVKLDSFDSLV